MSNVKKEGPRFSTTGMLISEACEKAEAWWDKTGRHLINQHSNTEEINRRVRVGNGRTPGFVVQGERRAVLRSGILRGLEWKHLDRREKQQIVKAWHELHVAEPELGLKSVAHRRLNLSERKEGKLAQAVKSEINH